MKKQVTFLLALALLLTACGRGGFGGVAATMHLKRAEGTVGVSDGEGQSVEPKENLGLYSGYGVDTREESYAWIDLDEAKVAKLDQESKIEITKDDKNLEIKILSGSLFFNVVEPLEDDETMDIHTSSMVVGVRGTCGWVALSEDATTLTVCLLEGKVECSNGDTTATVSAGERGTIPATGEITVSPLFAVQVPAFVKVELEGDDTLAEVVEAASGIDVLAPVPDSMRLRDQYAYSRMLNYNSAAFAPDNRDTLLQEYGYASDDQGRIGKRISYDKDGNEVGVSEYVYNDMGTLSNIKVGGRVFVTVTEDAADHRTMEYSSGLKQIYYYDEQGRLVEYQNYLNGEPTTVFRATYDAEGKLVQEDCYRSDGQIMSYCLYEYD